MSTHQRKLLQVMSVLLAVLAILTLLPIGRVIDASMLGYRALCSFAPISTILLTYVALSIHRYLKHSANNGAAAASHHRSVPQ